MLQGSVHIPPGEGRSLWVLGDLVTYKTTSDQTGGAYALFEVTTQPRVGPPPPEGPPGIGRIVSIAVNYGIEIPTPPGP